MKLTVSKYLNVRAGSPNLNAPCYQYLAPGSELEVEETLHTGDLYDGIDQWYKDASGNYYWSGGVERDMQLRFEATVINTWERSKGEGIKIALIDTGVISNHPRLPRTIIHSDLVSDGDIVFAHGTRMAGLISGVSSGLSRIMGMAPEVLLHDVKIFDKREFISAEKLIAALDLVEESDDIKIINLSIEFKDTGANPDISSEERIAVSHKLKVLSEKGKIIVCATGNHGYIAFPGNDDNVITIGALKNGLPVNFLNGLIQSSTKMPDCFIEFFPWEYCTLNNSAISNNYNSSEATALMSALIALLVKLNRNLNQQNIKQMISSCTTKRIYKNSLLINQLNIHQFLNS